MHVFSTSNSSHVIFFPQERNWFCQARQDLNPQLEGGWGGGAPLGDRRRPKSSKRRSCSRGGGRSMFKFTATVEKQAERAALHPPDVHSLALIRSWLTVKWTEQGPPWGGLQQHSTCPILGGICVMRRFLAPTFSFSWYKNHCNLVLWNTLNSKTEKKKKQVEFPFWLLLEIYLSCDAISCRIFAASAKQKKESGKKFRKAALCRRFRSVCLCGLKMIYTCHALSCSPFHASSPRQTRGSGVSGHTPNSWGFPVNLD